ncbi:MAG: M13 family metallopeptidase, partial [Ginsengibacter sp.]
AISLLLITVFASCNNAGTSDNTVPGKNFIISANMDSSVKPSDNFYMFVNGNWIKNEVIPPTESGTGAFLDVYNRTKDHLHMILDSVANGNFKKGSIEQKVGDLYASGMDSTTIEKLGDAPLQPYLRQIDSFTDVKSIMNFEAEINKLNHADIMGLYVGPDAKNSAVNILHAHQTSLGLPDRDYYFRTDSATIKVQDAYKNYITTLLMLLGNDSAAAIKKTRAIYALEKDIAASHKTNVQLRDPQSNYHKMAVTELDKQMPLIGWSAFLMNSGMKTDSIDLGQPAYYKKLNDVLAITSVATWKAYYTFHFTDDFASDLNSKFVNARFNYSKSLSGQQQMKPRWERVYWQVDGNLGEALGKLYVDEYFPKDAKEKIFALVNNLQKAFEARIRKVGWMSDSTKQIAIEKLHAFIKKIGYPDKWRDYSNVTINRNTYFDNLLSCSANQYQYQLNKLDKPVDKTEWGMTPPTINAYYNPQINEIVFPAGILQFPFFDPNADDAINYGAIGMVIGHEMTHGFDDQGSQFDKNGNLKNWWSTQDSAQFVARTKKIIDQFNNYTVLDTMHINGALTVGENSADLGGLSIAYDAFKMTKEGEDTARIGGFTPDQRFFIGFAQVWRSKTKPEEARTLINIDPHSPDMWRVNGPLSNFPPFYKAFNVQSGDKMYRPDSLRVNIW